MKLYRKMFEDADGRPIVGAGRNELGVRPADPQKPRQAADVHVSADGDLIPPGDGMSAFTDPGAISPLVQGVLYSIETDDLPDELTWEQRGKKPAHHHIEPKDEATLKEFQELLAETRDLWQREDGGTNP